MGKYILVVYDSYNKSLALQPFHGKAIALDINHQRAPLPLFFLIHEFMVRGRNFYQPTAELAVTDRWQEWIDDDNIANADGSFKHDAPAPSPSPTPGPSAPPGPASGHLQALSPSPFSSSGPSGSSYRTVIMPPTADLIDKLKVYQRTTPSWKAWEREMMGWEGTAEDNIAQYVKNIGVETA